MNNLMLAGLIAIYLNGIFWVYWVAKNEGDRIKSALLCLVIVIISLIFGYYFTEFAQRILYNVQVD